jgi:hypothetical protein
MNFKNSVCPDFWGLQKVQPWGLGASPPSNDSFWHQLRAHAFFVELINHLLSPQSIGNLDEKDLINLSLGGSLVVHQGKKGPLLMLVVSRTLWKKCGAPWKKCGMHLGSKGVALGGVGASGELIN